MNTILRWVVAGSLLLAGLASSLRAEPVPTSNAHANDPVLRWNEIALQACVEDHSGTFGPPAHGGPTRAARALAIIHIGMYDAVNAIVGGFEPYLPVVLPPETLDNASIDAAVAQAAHDTLADLYPAQQAVFARELQRDLAGVPANRGRSDGVLVGALSAANILAFREDDGGDAPDVPFPGGPKVIGAHQPDPLNPGQGLHVPLWGLVAPFAMGDVDDFLAIPPPFPNSPEMLERLDYAAAYDEVKRKGGDGVITPTERNAEQTMIGLFWAYDGTIDLGVPPRLYNQIARVICLKEHNSVVTNARELALVNIAMADAGIASWHAKYIYNFWRPVVGIRCGDEDDNEFTDGDPNWTPLGAPATNQSNGGVDFTPPFPAYTSGHATFGAALFKTLAHLHGDEYEFQLISDEMNGRNTDSAGNHRRAVMRQFQSFSQASQENADSRIYLGIHWRFDADEGMAIGNAIGDHTFATLLTPTP